MVEKRHLKPVIWQAQNKFIKVLRGNEGELSGCRTQLHHFTLTDMCTDIKMDMFLKVNAHTSSRTISLPKVKQGYANLLLPVLAY